MTKNNADADSVKAKAFQIYKEACGLGVGFNKNLRAVDLRVMQVLLSYMNHLSYTSFPSLNTIRAPLGIHKRTLQRSLNKLDVQGHIRRQRRWNAKSRKWDNMIYLPLIPDILINFIEARFAGQPMILGVIKATRNRFQRMHNLPLGGGVDLPGGRGVDLPPKPLIEPSN